MQKIWMDESGASMVEFAIVAGLVFFPMVFGIVEFGRAVWARNMVTAAAREGVRFAIVRGSTSGAVADSSAIATFVKGRTGLSPLIVRPVWENNTKDPGTWVEVRVTYNYVPVVPILGSKTIIGTSRQLISF